ncbi:MAG: hypothetical protein QG604_75 [Candidatus Dependentiae bacterium]|nr:hypothetical protein [Candidatus Dependentiae bacterium]
MGIAYRYPINGYWFFILNDWYSVMRTFRLLFFFTLLIAATEAAPKMSYNLPLSIATYFVANSLTTPGNFMCAGFGLGSAAAFAIASAKAANDLRASLKGGLPKGVIDARIKKIKTYVALARVALQFAAFSALRAKNRQGFLAAWAASTLTYWLATSLRKINLAGISSL